MLAKSPPLKPVVQERAYTCLCFVIYDLPSRFGQSRDTVDTFVGAGAV